MNSSHIHLPEDGRGRRRVFVNGREIQRVTFADTRKGVVRYIPDPIKVHKHKKRVISRTLQGAVVVEFER